MIPSLQRDADHADTERVLRNTVRLLDAESRPRQGVEVAGLVQERGRGLYARSGIAPAAEVATTNCLVLGLVSSR
jgi:hypothetical protein